MTRRIQRQAEQYPKDDDYLREHIQFHTGDPEMDEKLFQQLRKRLGEGELDHRQEQADREELGLPPASGRPPDYADLKPTSPEDLMEMARIWWGPDSGEHPSSIADTPRKLKNRVNNWRYLLDPDTGSARWNDWHPYQAVPDKWEQYAEYKRRQREVG